jgi:predicted Zn-dependent protease
VSAARPGAGRAETQALLLAERVLGLVRARAASAEAEVNVRTGTLALTRFANGVIHQNVAEELREVGVRVALDGRVASARLDGPAGDDKLRALVEGVFEAAAVSPVDDDWPGLASPTPSPDVDHWDDATADASPDERAALVASFVSAAEGLVTAGAVSTAAVHAAFASTAGQAVTGRGTSADIDGIARTGTSDGVARHSSVRVASLDAAAAGRRAARKARDGADPGDLEPGRYEVVLEPSCVADIVDFVLVHGFGGRAVHEGRSFVRPGEAQLDPSVTLRQDVADPRLGGLAFDAEGTPRRAVDLVRDGVTGAILHDRRTARLAGAESTGNAALGPNPYGGVPASLILEPGATSPASMVTSIERGLLVTDFWYTRVLDPKTLVITGLTRNGVWLVEDGRIVRPVRNLRFTQGYAQALGPGNVKAVGDDPTLFSHGPDDQLLVPSLHLASWAFTGGAKG